MRLIDADALIEEIEKQMENGFPANENLSLYAISCLAHAPTVCDIEQIRDEIDAYMTAAGYTFNMQKNDVRMGVLKIIDKYLK